MDDFLKIFNIYWNCFKTLSLLASSLSQITGQKWTIWWEASDFIMKLKLI